MQIDGLIRYYRECFKEDSSDFNLRNLLRLNKEDLLFIKGEDEIASGNLHRLPIDPKYGESFSKRIEIYQRERVLLYCSLFISGKLATDGEQIQLFSPLVVNEATIEHDEYGYYFSIDQTSPSVNEELLSLILPESSELPVFDVNRIYDPSFWIKTFEDSPYELNTIESLRFPVLGSREDTSKAMRRKYPSLLPISCLAFVERSASSRGILHELTILSKQQNFSKPVSTILGISNNIADKIPVNHRLVPGTLSAAQKKVLEIAANNTLGVVSGPPGTGKSYTIAAIAAEHFTRGQSVLIVANSDIALDVIAEKLSKDFGLDNLFVRVGQKAVLREFKQYLDDLLAGYHDHSESDNSARYKDELDHLIQTIEEQERRLEKGCTFAFKHGSRADRIVKGSASLWDKIIHKLRASAIDKGAELWQISGKFNQLIEEKEALTTQYLRAAKARIISQLLDSDRKAVQTLNKASRARTSSKQSEYFSNANFESLLSGFPVWLVTLNTLHRVLPLSSELFDLVVIDEATQCNISSVLPALERAERAIVVGDKKQLKHYSFLARSKQKDIADLFGVSDNEKALSYRDETILDLAISSTADQSQVAFLDEHFRSQPELIHFSNEHFYGKNLKVMQHRPCSTKGHVQVIQVNGKRTSSGINQEEADAIMSEIKLIATKDAELGIRRTIGVLSPFSKQVAHLSKSIEKSLPLDLIQAHKLRVATPYGFQGEERDIMLLSFCVDENSKRAASYLKKPDVFNVSVTRARQLQHIYLSIQPHVLPSDNLLRKYLASVESFELEHTSEHQPDDFQGDVLMALKELDIDCWQGYELLGTYIDILARCGDRYVAIDLIGYPGPWKDFFELDTYKVIKRAGIEVFPLSYALWSKDRASCLAAIEKAVQKSNTE